MAEIKRTRHLVLVNTRSGPMHVAVNDAVFVVAGRAVRICDVETGMVDVRMVGAAVPIAKVAVNRPTNPDAAVDFVYVDICSVSRFVLVERFTAGAKNKPYAVLREYATRRPFSVCLKYPLVRYVQPFARMPVSAEQNERVITLVPLDFTASHAERLACVAQALEVT